MSNRIIRIVTVGRQPALLDDRAMNDARDHSSTSLDSLQRPLRDLRISVTDRCNLRCTYCMPREIFDESHTFLPRAELLTFEEIERVVRQFIKLGVKKIRLTGGEPLLRRGIERLIEKLAGLQTLTGEPLEIALTTNAVLLARKAKDLKTAGLSRVTVSLDSLSDATFRRMSDTDVAVGVVLEGIEAAQAAGLGQLKINMVVKRGVNEHEIVPMAAHFRHAGIVLRYIEFMDVGCTNGWRMDDVVPAQEILDRLVQAYPLEQIDPAYSGEVAERWRYADGGGEIGVIASVTQAFCQECTRARLSTDGKLYTCLFANEGLDLRTPLRRGAGDRVLADLIADRWGRRTDRYSLLRHEATGHVGKVEMSYIGG
ncbi:GTP 3',8-cyclase MoaA [Sideroxydans lithotrophicus]|uniref:GTP 3',8-cyclase n=1 Tax=Sideroxydans lithotrophicus (strain ES-1) TaxID=580332 RepID=D5CNX4_SIDLE|nr:GTP 3',8-cyclase MoaA [Sideroxydans lithotrophicus]ADE12895.1 molybdenum cofactor biosynthesis protein A [Sideroxydans lithotrophicus ES-1]